MKKILLLIISIGLLLNGACNQNNSAENENQPSKDFLLVDHTSHKGFKIESSFPNEVSYFYSGSITNNTTNIYKSATIYMTVIFNLKNGEQITDKDTHNDDALFDWSGVKSLHVVEMFQPNEKYDLEEFESHSIDLKYAKYPIKSVIVSFRIKLLDEVNNTENEVFLKEEDVTDNWSKVVGNSR